MKKLDVSHVDHDLTTAQLDWLLTRFKDRDSFFIETVELLESLGTVPCGLYGPEMGDDPIEETDVSYARRGDREYSSRMIARPTRPTRQVTVIAGPHEEHACVLYTAFGGPSAPQEPGDPGCKDVSASKQFWAQHALAASIA
ncbi:MAG: hypothetical protein CMK74_05990 [Pseudomonadales bacterium]|jgi:hypothetical protein|nr:hypothetical protein [Pseudomonadales bacterium]|tara:strand:+ start:908 stop:1333 length:426 start_codon:yes stop_codon:yes gene_type:complete